MPPCPEPAAVVPFQNPINILLDDVDKELLVLKAQILSGNHHSGSLPFSSILASKEIMRMFSCMDCMIA